jgi:excisionase family DNA binding protein
MTIPEAAEALGLKASTLRLQIKLRKLKAHKMGSTWYVNPAEVERYRQTSLRKKTSEYRG